MEGGRSSIKGGRVATRGAHFVRSRLITFTTIKYGEVPVIFSVEVTGPHDATLGIVNILYNYWWTADRNDSTTTQAHARHKLLFLLVM